MFVEQRGFLRETGVSAKTRQLFHNSVVNVEITNMKTKLFAASLFLAAFVNIRGQPTIAVQPKSKTASLFADVTLSVVAAGTGDLSYQWQLNEMPIKGAVAR